MPPSGPGFGGIRILLSREVQSVSGAVVRSTNSVFFFFFLVNMPTASNCTRPPVATEVGIDVLVAAGRGVNVGVGVFFLGVVEGVVVAVGDGGGPSDIVKV